MRKAEKQRVRKEERHTKGEGERKKMKEEERIEGGVKRRRRETELNETRKQE